VISVTNVPFTPHVTPVSIDIVEEDDKSVTFTAGAQLDGDGANGQYGGVLFMRPKAMRAKHSMLWRMLADQAIRMAWLQTQANATGHRSFKVLVVHVPEHIFRRLYN
jgi:hypothetical protein